MENQLSNLIGVLAKKTFQAGGWSLVTQKSKSKWPPFFTDNLIILKNMFFFKKICVGFFWLTIFPTYVGYAKLKKNSYDLNIGVRTLEIKIQNSRQF